MYPRLVAIDGPLNGQVVPVDDGEFSIGRDVANSLPIEDRAISRRHCLLTRDGEQVKIADLGSRNGSYVNNIPVRERILAHGDQVRVGHSVFVVLLEEGDEVPSPEAVLLDDSGLVAGATVVMRGEDALHPKSKAPDAQSDRTLRNLETLLEIGASISAARQFDDLQRRLLELTLGVIPAEHGAIALAGKTPEDFASVFHWNRRPPHDRAIQVSRTVLSRVVRERNGLLANDVRQSEALSLSDSLNKSSVRSLLAAPVVFFERVLGAVYLATTDPKTRFDEDHLQLLMGIAGVAAGALDSALRIRRLEGENQRLAEEISLEHDMVGESPEMKEVHRFIAKAAPTGATVLIHGESGTGKELVARAIHRNSPRASQPFVAINCAALTETLLESELFGHEKGAFTGAIAQKKGKLEAADGGTVFLDEIGEMPLAMQSKLLRVLQEREFERVGGTRPIRVDIRLIAATNRDLAEEARRNTFRQDLYYRLNVVSVKMPALRERRGDIPILARYFALKHGRKMKREVTGISDEALACLAGYDWPGNVRELENAIERAVVLGSTESILPEDLPDCVAEVECPGSAQGAGFQNLLKDTKRQLIVKALEQTGGKYVEAARLLGMHPNNLHRLMRTLNLKADLKK